MHNLSMHKSEMRKKEGEREGSRDREERERVGVHCHTRRMRNRKKSPLRLIAVSGKHAGLHARRDSSTGQLDC